MNAKDKDAVRIDRVVSEELYDINKVMAKARLGRCYLYSMDFGPDRWLADVVFTLANREPCRIVATQPLLAKAGITEKPPVGRRKSGNYIVAHVPTEAEEISMYTLFTFNPNGEMIRRKAYGRSWQSYCDAFPEETNRTIVRWPLAPNGDEVSHLVGIKLPPPNGDEVSHLVAKDDPTVSHQSTLLSACHRVVETDGILLTDADHLDAALEAMSYVITRNDDPYAPGGLYYGYMLRDRVFKDTDGRDEWRATQELSDDKESVRRREWSKNRFLERKGKSLVEIVQPETARQLEKLWNEKIEGEKLSDKKTSKFFTLEAPIEIGDTFADMVAREFRRVAFSGTMAYQQQLVRPAHEVALGIWLARLEEKGSSSVLLDPAR